VSLHGQPFGWSKSRDVRRLAAINGLSPSIGGCLLMRGKLPFGMPSERATGRIIPIAPTILRCGYTAITPMISATAVHCFIICGVLPDYPSLEHPYFLKSGQPSATAGPLTRARGKDSFDAMLTVVVVSTK
jgi:hypothetical protein